MGRPRKEPDGRAERRTRAGKATVSLARPVRDPVTGERYYSDDEREFLAECEAYSVRYKRRFMTASEYLHVAIAMGYRKTSACPAST